MATIGKQTFSHGELETLQYLLQTLQSDLRVRPKDKVAEKRRKQATRPPVDKLLDAIRDLDPSLYETSNLPIDLSLLDKAGNPVPRAKSTAPILPEELPEEKLRAKVLADRAR
jgi:hypothetical protein